MICVHQFLCTCAGTLGGELTLMLILGPLGPVEQTMEKQLLLVVLISDKEKLVYKCRSLQNVAYLFFRLRIKSSGLGHPRMNAYSQKYIDLTDQQGESPPPETQLLS